MLAAGNSTIIGRTIPEIALYLKATKPLVARIAREKTSRGKNN
jgi:hypothetical protein